MIVERNEMDERDERDKDSNYEDQGPSSNKYLGPAPAHLNQNNPKSPTQNQVETSSEYLRPTPNLVNEDSKSPQSQLPSQDNERQLNQRMKSIIVQKVTKMYTASQDPLTDS